jgi:hypothetical protein
MHNHFIERVYTEEDQSERIQYPEEEIRLRDAMEEETKSGPGENEEKENADKHISPAVEKAPVVEEPRKKAKIKDGKTIEQRGEQCFLTGIQEDHTGYLYYQYKANIINKGIVRYINNAISYYPDYYSKYYTQTK